MRRREFIALLGSAAAAWPLAARAQQPASMKRIGVLMGYAEADVEAQSWVKAFALGLQERGWADGSTVRIDYRWATGSLDRMRSNAAELVGLKPNMILAGSTPALSAVRQETRSVPIVFVNVADPIGQGFVSSLANPGGNITGFTSLEFSMGSRRSRRFHLPSPALWSFLIPRRHRTSRFSIDRLRTPGPRLQ
jgi:putative ABC transport system substrate-binding protein